MHVKRNARQPSNPWLPLLTKRKSEIMSDIAALHERLAAIETTQGHQGDLLEKMDKKLDKIGDRVTSVEINSAKYGSIAGGIISVGVAVIMEKLKGTA